MLDAIRARTRAAVLTEEPFCVLPELQFARAALQRLQQPATALERGGLLTMLIGPAGCGKSALVRQSLRELLRKDRQTSVLILNHDDWSAVSSEEQDQASWENWIAACSEFDVVVLEDLDQVVTDEEQANHLAHALDALLNEQVDIIVTSSRSPANCDEFSPRLTNRLRGGLMARITPLEVSSRRLFLNWASELRQVSLAEPVSDWLVEQPPGSIRSLQQIVDRLAAEFPPPTRIGDLPAVRRVVTAIDRPRLSLSAITQEVAAEFGVTAQELRMATRVQACRLPRQCAMHLAHQLGGWPMAEIGRYFGKRTHTSVSYSCKKFEETLETTPSLRTQLQRLQTQLNERMMMECG